MTITTAARRWGIPYWQKGQSTMGRFIPRGLAAAGVAMALVAGVGNAAAATDADQPQGTGYQRPGTTERVSVPADGGTDGGGFPSRLGMSSDARFVAFVSEAKLVPGDTNGDLDVFVRDRETGTTERVSVESDGAEFEVAAGWSMSADGRFVAFYAIRSSESLFHVYVRDRLSDTTELVSLSADGSPGNDNSSYPEISADGRFVAFLSFATNLVAGDTNALDDIFVHDRQTGATERVSVASDGSQGTDDGGAGCWSNNPISADGRFVAFLCSFDNLDAGDTNAGPDAFVRDRDADEDGVFDEDDAVTTERVSVRSDETELETGAGNAALDISADGRFVTFDASAAVVPTNTSGLGVFVRDREAGITERVSVDSSGSEVLLLGEAASAAISADGRLVAFISRYREVPDDESTDGDRPAITFLRDRETGSTERVSVASDGTDDNEAISPSVELTGDGRYVAWTSGRSNVPDDTNGVWDVFVRDRGPATGIGALTVEKGAGQHTVTGWATFSGATVASVKDPDTWPDDSTEVQDGVEMLAASLVYRPELEDLLIRVDLQHLPRIGISPPDLSQGASTGCRPGNEYEMRFTVRAPNAETQYRVKWSCPGTTSKPGGLARVGLSRCADSGDPRMDAVCELDETRLDGSVGTTGPSLLASLPLAALGFDGTEDLTITDSFGRGGHLEARSKCTEPCPLGPGLLLGPSAMGRDVLQFPDPVRLESGDTPRVELAVAAPSTPESELAFTTAAALTDGRFSATIPVPDPSEPWRLWARGCLGEVCGVRWVDVDRPA